MVDNLEDIKGGGYESVPVFSWCDFMKYIFTLPLDTSRRLGFSTHCALSLISLPYICSVFTFLAVMFPCVQLSCTPSHVFMPRVMYTPLSHCNVPLCLRVIKSFTCLPAQCSVLAFFTVMFPCV
jgi:hypothetical protein